MIKFEFSIVNSVETKFESHIFDTYTSARLHLVITNPHNERVYSLIFALYNSLSKDNGIVSMACSIGDPILLRQSSR
jgi:hypothetical protein